MSIKNAAFVPVKCSASLLLSLECGFGTELKNSLVIFHFGLKRERLVFQKGGKKRNEERLGSFWKNRSFKM